MIAIKISRPRDHENVSNAATNLTRQQIVRSMAKNNPVCLSRSQLFLDKCTSSTDCFTPQRGQNRPFNGTELPHWMQGVFSGISTSAVNNDQAILFSFLILSISIADLIPTTK